MPDALLRFNHRSKSVVELQCSVAIQFKAVKKPEEGDFITMAIELLQKNEKEKNKDKKWLEKLLNKTDSQKLKAAINMIEKRAKISVREYVGFGVIARAALVYT